MHSLSIKTFFWLSKKYINIFLKYRKILKNNTIHHLAIQRKKHCCNLRINSWHLLSTVIISEAFYLVVIQNLEMAGVILSISWLSQEIFGKGTESNNLLLCIEVTNKLDDSVLTPVVNHVTVVVNKIQRRTWTFLHSFSCGFTVQWEGMAHPINLKENLICMLWSSWARLR